MAEDIIAHFTTPKMPQFSISETESQTTDFKAKQEETEQCIFFT